MKQKNGTNPQFDQSIAFTKNKPRTKTTIPSAHEIRPFKGVYQNQNNNPFPSHACKIAQRSKSRKPRNPIQLQIQQTKEIGIENTRIRMNEIETQIKGNLSESEVDVNRQARRASCWEAKARLPCNKSEFLVIQFIH